MSDLVRSIAGLGGDTIDLDKQRQQSTPYGSRSAMTQIQEIRAREILDSRGNPTVEADYVSTETFDTANQIGHENLARANLKL